MGQPNMEQNPPKSPHATASSEEDNLDYESEDDDDSRSNYSTNNQNSNISTLTNGSDRAGGGGQGGGRHGSGRHSTGSRGEETKRSHHNVLERKRRDLLKDSFTKLRDSVPTTQPKERVSRAEILKQAADFIQARVQQNARARAELDELIRKNQELEAKQKSPNTSAAVAAAAAAKVVAGRTSPASRVTGTIISSNSPKEPPAHPD